MLRKPAAKHRRRGLSLLEMMAATAIMATITASVVVVMRSGYAIWNAQEADIDVLENGYGVLRHFFTQMRQATSITAISASNNTQGSLSFTTSSGVTRIWARDASSNVYFNNGTLNQLLAKNILSLTFTGYKADGVTTTTTVSDIQVVQCQVQIILPRGAGVTRTLTSKAWVRCW
ncbi:MAG TPA: prepilin-type N-terminal cleavage/methylation domain-containing protein [Lacipirellulaceae bacterium]|jgi:prepilin-type N-terminal cleavage/methylation domain-containing protein|nr:prepilin-type N-terminal cleavage/methylation domain-containing protein [Lacipirellulaceae bacterium]